MDSSDASKAALRAVVALAEASKTDAIVKCAIVQMLDTHGYADLGEFAQAEPELAVELAEGLTSLAEQEATAEKAWRLK